MIQQTLEVIPARVGVLRRYDRTAGHADLGCGSPIALMMRDGDDGTRMRYHAEGGEDMLIVDNATKTWLAAGVFRDDLGFATAVPCLECVRC